MMDYSKLTRIADGTDDNIVFASDKDEQAELEERFSGYNVHVEIASSEQAKLINTYRQRIDAIASSGKWNESLKAQPKEQSNERPQQQSGSKEQPKKQSFISKAANTAKQGMKNLYDQMSNEEV